MRWVGSLIVLFCVLCCCLCFDDYEFAINEAEQVPVTNQTATALEQKLPATASSRIFGLECHISNAAYPNEFLYMISGWKGDYPVMEPGLPRRPLANWNWRGMWLVKEVNYNGELYYQFMNHHYNKYLSFNPGRSKYIKGKGDGDALDTLWGVMQRGSAYAIHHSSGFLHAMTRKTKKDNRFVGVLNANPDKEIYNWRINCFNSKGRIS